MTLISVGRIASVLAVAGIGFSAAAFADPQPPRYVVIAIPPGPPQRMNDSGEIAGRMNVTSGTITRQHAAAFRGGAWVDLGTLGEDTVSIATDVNNLGVVVGMSNRTFGFANSTYRAVQIAPGGVMQAVAGLDGLDSIAYGVNDSGQICGRKGPDIPDSNKPWHAFISIAPDQPVLDLHSAVEAALGASRSETTASDINGAGDVVGQASQSFTPSSGFVRRSQDGKITILAGPDGSGGTWSLYAPAAINDLGLIAGVAILQPAGGSSVASAATYDMTSGIFTPLTVPPGAGTLVRSEAYDLDAAGRVVGHTLAQQSPTSFRNFAFIYEHGEMVDLNTLIPADSGWQLETAIAISNNGQIVGDGRFQGQYGYFLLTPANKPPTVSLAAPPSVDEGSPVTLSASASDPDAGTLAYEWDLDGDGTYEAKSEDSEVVLSPAGDDGPATRTVGVRVTDDGGLTATTVATIEIRNVAPTATLISSAATTYVNTGVTLTLTNAFDPSQADTVTGFSYAWDCSDDGVFEASGAATNVCAYAASGVRTARARISDKNGGFSDYLATVNVRTAEEGIAGLIQIVLSFGLPHGIENSFLTKLEHARDALLAGLPGDACADLEAFISHAQAQSGKTLTVEQASQIIGEAEAIRAALGC